MSLIVNRSPLSPELINSLGPPHGQSEEIQGKPTVIIQDRQVEVDGKGKDFYAKYFVQNPGTEDEVVKFIIKDYKDSFNRKGSPVTTTTDLSRVVILAVK